MDHLVIHRHEAYTLQKEAEAEAKDFVERTKGLFERFVDWCRSTGSYVLPLPGRVAVNAGLVCYDTYTLATRLLSPEQSLDIKGLSSESERAFVEQTAHLYDRSTQSMFDCKSCFKFAHSNKKIHLLYASKWRRLY